MSTLRGEQMKLTHHVVIDGKQVKIKVGTCTSENGAALNLSVVVDGKPHSEQWVTETNR
ncbi:hypothetical protein [Rhodococcus globerulus]|uniref:Transposase n=1 Tax=Rhodococcus globerulus TaxID=33008 RepID=A0ABU4BS62_RHOGO|nr:hypothetical protein [Rhodococcus globerulus]MDV6267062.1 hypothetical protein [Rhodococcus globerulus]